MAQTFITCSFCGKREDVEPYRMIKTPLVTRMRGEQLCFDCAYWKCWMDNPEPDTLVISGAVYKLTQPLRKPNYQASTAKAMQFLVDVNDPFNLFATKELILRGKVPEKLNRTILRDQYKFISRTVYNRIKYFGAEFCLSKGCFDRYHCLWYRADIAEPSEPWNTIPKKYVIGSECCPSFVDKYELCNSD
jgi:hypothetical protein